ncbi:hypothetical protein NMY22_g453 [Coprinellus aureogranulatus]|nr:hypothetical protein NMY22_g453 [Coprinellus aureogranulatus]
MTLATSFVGFRLHSFNRTIEHFLSILLSSAARIIRRLELCIARLWKRPLDTQTPPPHSSSSRSVVRRNRRAMALEPENHISSLQTFASSGGVPVQVFRARRPKSLQHSRQWRNMSSSRSSNAPAPPTPKPRIDLHIQVARNALRGGRYTEFRECFRYEAPAGIDAQPMQAIMEDLFDNPVIMESSEGKIVRAPPEEQPDIVVHRMYWQGEEEQAIKVLNVALGTMLVNLSIDHCSLGLQEVAAVLALTPVLDSLEVRDVNDMLNSASQSNEPEIINNLSSLTITSHIQLDSLFEKVKFPRLAVLSLRLHGTGYPETIDKMVPSAFPPKPSDPGSRKDRTVRLRCQLVPGVKKKLEDSLTKKGVRLDYGNL